LTAPSSTICVLGLGYIGLPTASLLATKGFRVRGVDSNPAVAQAIARGEVHIQEPDLDVLVKSAVQSGRLTAHAEPAPSDVFIIAVPTPFKGAHEPDLAYVEAAAKSLAPHLKPGNLVVLESTSPVGTTEKVAQWVRAARPDLHIPAWTKKQSGTAAKDSVYFAHCPERVLPGQIMRELIENDRVIGGIDPASTQKARALYASFCAGKILLTDSRTAEMCKLTENACRDVNIAFANELSLLCDRLDVDVWELIDLANHHPRVKVLQPGPGVGGHCIAVDPWFLAHAAPDAAKLIRAAREVNDSKPDFVLKKIETHAAKFKQPVIACLGLAFKANVDDLRESPALEITQRLAEKKIAKVLAVEPYVETLPIALQNAGIEKTDLETALTQADIVVLLVNHRDFDSADRVLLKEKIVIDPRGAWRNL
jgi:UDP-N-acetyl-D-mannosaminuronic acid dehydrogenase